MAKTTLFEKAAVTGTLASYLEKKQNNLNAIRLSLALLVLWSHCIPLALGGMASGSHVIQTGAGPVAVDMFFFISGLLITGSWLRSKSMDDYLRKRILRIYPGYIVAVVFTTVAMVAANPGEMLKFAASWRGIVGTIWDCIELSQRSLMGENVFPHNPYPNAANGSLWTIPIEFKCYLLICLIGLFRLFKFRWMTLVLFGVAYGLLLKAMYLGWDIMKLDRRFVVYFSAGICAWVWSEKIKLSAPIALIALISSFANIMWNRSLNFTEPFALTYLMLYIGYVKPINILDWCNTTDLSYGVYLYAFPIQQLIAMGVYGHNPRLMFLMAAPLALLAAFFSWHMVEKRFLRMKSLSFFERDAAIPGQPIMEAIKG